MATATAHKGSFFTACDRTGGVARPANAQSRPVVRNVLALGMLLLLVVLSAGCASHTPAEKAALARAETLPQLDTEFFDQEIFTGAPCALLLEPQMTITKVDGAPGHEFGLPEKNSIFVSPGEHALSIVVATAGTVGNSTSHTSGNVTASMGFSARVMMPEVTLPFTFEEGKHYRLKFASWTGLELAFEEITDETELATATADAARKQAANREKAGIAAAYLDFTRQNPQWLEGKWAVGEEKDELEFSGSAVRYVAAKSFLISTRNTLEGSFMYDQNTIVIRWNSITTFLNSVTREDNPGFFINTAWYYTLDGDTLDIKRGGFIIPVDIGGTYRRVRPETQDL